MFEEGMRPEYTFLVALTESVSVLNEENVRSVM